MLTDSVGGFLFQHTAAQRRLQNTPSSIIGKTCFNTQPRRGGCLDNVNKEIIQTMFQHTAAQRRLLARIIFQWFGFRVSTHSRAEAAASGNNRLLLATILVSTHSRAEAAAVEVENTVYYQRSFNTQPRRGGCLPNCSGGRLM